MESLKNKYYVDEIYDVVIVQNLKRLGIVLWKFVDGMILDGTLNGLANSASRVSLRLRGLQTGLAQQYVFWIWIGVILLIAGASVIH